LLCHQGGFVDSDGSFGVYQKAFGVPSMASLLEGKTPYSPQRAQLQYEPMSQFSYSDLGYCIIEQVIEDVMGKSFTELLETLVLKPLGMRTSCILLEPSLGYKESLTFGHSKKGELVEGGRAYYPFAAAAGLWCSSGDLALLLMETFNGLKGEGVLSVSREYIHDMMSPQGGIPWCGLGVFLEGEGADLELSSFGWGVGYQCLLLGYVHRQEGAVIMTNTDTGVHQLKGFIGDVVRVLYGENV
jgi:CubicO group peptidase (beta-lactamase class C family)